MTAFVLVCLCCQLSCQSLVLCLYERSSAVCILSVWSYLIERLLLGSVHSTVFECCLSIYPSFIRKMSFSVLCSHKVLI